MMQDAAALNHVIDIFELIGIQNVDLLELNVVHPVLLRFSGCIRQAVLADVYGSNLRIFVAAGVDNLVSSPASRN